MKVLLVSGTQSHAVDIPLPGGPKGMLKVEFKKEDGGDSQWGHYALVSENIEGITPTYVQVFPALDGEWYTINRETIERLYPKIVGAGL